jgi:hypothetical protein
MSEQTLYVFQLTSTFSVALPLGIGLLKFTKADGIVKTFIIFLLIGLASDLSGWYFYLSHDGTSNLYQRHIYDFIESVFLFWFLSRVTPSQLARRFFLWSIVILIPFWAMRFLYLDAMAIYMSTAQVFIAFGACFSLLQLVETKTEVTEQLTFWILLGMFFYCFGSFFFMGILVSKLGKIWYAHNVVNIITNLIYFIGLLRAKNMSIS